jgi:uncharacterized repeat protein (TIGR03803 family)
VSTSGTGFSVLHAFGGGSDGSNAFGTLIDVHGVLLGTTSRGGASADGTVFRVGSDGTNYRVMYSFGAATGDGISPFGGLAALGGALYGTTAGGGTNNDAGIVFSIATSGSSYVVLHDFGKGSDGMEPIASLTAVNGVLYGVTLYGGAYPCVLYVECGTIFSIDPSGAERVLHNFGKGSDGYGPQATLFAVGSTLYGTTIFGGTSGRCRNGHGVVEHFGTVFRIDANGMNYAILHDFGRSATPPNPTVA